VGLLPAKATAPSSWPTVLRPASTSSSVVLPEPEGLHRGVGTTCMHECKRVRVGYRASICQNICVPCLC
jgi:hypothetical protein